MVGCSQELQAALATKQTKKSISSGCRFDSLHLQSVVDKEILPTKFVKRTKKHIS